MSILPSRLSLRGRILLLFFALTVLPVTVVAVLYYFFPDPYSLDHRREQRVVEIADHAAAILELRREEVAMEVQRAVVASTLPDGGDASGPDPSALRRGLETIPGWRSARLVPPGEGPGWSVRRAEGSTARGGSVSAGCPVPGATDHGRGGPVRKRVAEVRSRRTIAVWNNVVFTAKRLVSGWCAPHQRRPPRPGQHRPGQAPRRPAHA